MSPQICYCINPDCQQPEHPDNAQNRFCNQCGSDLLINGKYRVKRLLSDNSGFGIIYEAESNQRKILKVLKPEHNNNPKIIDLFKQEYQVLLNLTQQEIRGIPQVEQGDYLTYKTKKGLILHCIFMEKVEGVDLEQWVKNNGQLVQKQAFKWLREITEILGKIHVQNYFHRDVKPANIMQRLNGDLVLIDFGTAREETQTYYQKLQHRSVTGIKSAGYTPDEQINGKAVMQSDFFALGRTFVYLLTGQSPLDMYDGYNNILSWREHTENIHPLFLDFIDELMAVSAKDRPANAKVILQRLKDIEKQVNQSETMVSTIMINSPINPILNNLKTQTQTVKQAFKVHKKLLIPSLLLLIGIGYGISQYNEINIIHKTEVIQSGQPIPKNKVTSSQLTATEYFNQGLAHYNQKEYEEAISDYNEAINLNYNYDYAYNNRGLAYQDLKEYDLAIADYTEAIKINPNYALAYYNIGVLYGQQNNYQVAINYYTKALESKGEWGSREPSDAYNNRGLAHANLQEYDQALLDYNQAINLNPSYAHAYYNRGLVYEQWKNTKDALFNFRQSAVLYQEQGNTEWYNNAMNKIRELDSTF